MARKLRTSTLVDIDNIDRITRILREAHARAKEAGCPLLAKKIASAIASSEGANRHAWRCYRRTKEAEARNV